MMQRRTAWTYLVGEDGQGLTEYALIIALIAVTCASTVFFFGGGVTGLYDSNLAALPFP